MLSKKLLIPILAVVVAGSTMFGLSRSVSAQTNSPMSGLAQAIASKFSLNESDVQTAITTYMQSQKGKMMQNMQNRQKKRLDALVSQGKITSAQETAILGEWTTLQSQYSPTAKKGMTQAQRQQSMQNEKNAITTWANAQGINPMYVMPFGGRGRIRGGWSKNQPTTTPTPTTGS